MHCYSYLKSTHEILMKLVQAPRQPVVVDVYVEIVGITVARTTASLGHDHPGFVHHDPFPVGVLGSRFAVYWHAAIFIILQVKFVSSPWGNDHAHVFVGVGFFVTLIWLSLSVSIEQGNIYHLTASA